MQGRDILLCLSGEVQFCKSVFHFTHSVKVAVIFKMKIINEFVLVSCVYVKMKDHVVKGNNFKNARNFSTLNAALPAKMT